MTRRQCAHRIMDTVPVAMRFIRREMRGAAAVELSVPQFRTLVLLGRRPGASLSEVAEHLGVTKATASVTVARLVGRGLVDRRTDPEERRRIALTLTGSGAGHLELARQSTVETVARALSRLPAEDVAKIGEGMALLQQVLTEVTSSHGH